MAIVSAGHALGVLNYVFLSSEGIKPDTRQAINIYRLSYSFVGFVCVQVCDHCSSMQLDIIMSPFYVPMLTQNEPRRQKTGLRGFRPGPTQIGLGNHRRWLEARNFGTRKKYYPCSENKGADQLCGYRTTDLRLCFRICKNPVFSRRGSNYYSTFYT